MGLHLMNVNISINLVEAFQKLGWPLTPNFYSALLFIDQNLFPCSIYSHYNENLSLVWVRDAGDIVGAGSTRIEAVEDVLRQFYAQRKPI